MAPDKHEIDLVADRIRRELHSIEEREAGIAALRAALIEGEESGASTPFDFEAFIARKQKRKDP